MIVIITPFIQNKADYRLYNTTSDRINTHVNLAEPYWYSNPHPGLLCFMYGGKVQKRPDILESTNLESLVTYFDQHYHYDALIHIPRDLHLNVNLIEHIVSHNLFFNFPKITRDHLSKSFILHGDQYFEIPIETIDATEAQPQKVRAPVVQFEVDNHIEVINAFLSETKRYELDVDDRYLPIAIGGWCGIAEALKSLGLRDEAYPFDYIISDLGTIVDLLDLSPPSDEKIESILFGEGQESKMEFVHHKTEDPSVRTTLVERTNRFIERVSQSERPVLFIRAARNDIDLVTEIQESRRLLDLTAEKFQRPDDRVLLISNYQELPTGKLSKLRSGRIIVWNAMGVNGWKVPNNWLLITNLVKIISHELNRLCPDSEINFKKVPDFRKIPDDENRVHVEPPVQSKKDEEEIGICKVTVHLSEQEPLELRCDETSPIISILFQAIYESETHPTKQGELVHLRIEEQDKTQDIVLRSSQICRIEVSPPLKPGAIQVYKLQPLSFLARCKRKTKHLLNKLKR